MTKVATDTLNYELTERDSQRVTASPTASNKVDQKSVAYDNPGFFDQRPSASSLGNGTIITTKLEIKNEEEDEEDDDEDKNNAGFERLSGDGHKLGLFVLSLHGFLVRMIQKEKKLAVYAIKILLLIGFIIFFGFAMSEKYGTPAFPIRGNVFYGNQGFAMFLLVAVAVFIIAWETLLGRSLERLIKFISKSNRNNRIWIQIGRLLNRFTWVLHLLVFFGVALYVGLTVSRARNLVSLVGIFTLILLGTLGSKYPHRIPWQTVLYSFILQFILAVFVIRVEVGFELFDFLGAEVTKFINNADAGARFVFGDTYQDHFYVFKITSIIIFLGSVINVLYYYGVMQFVIGKIAWLMQKCLNTTAAESMNAAANIFVGMSEAPLLIMPLVPKMTTSELHAVLVGGFATMAGSVLATFILFGVPANHLIAASVMAAPGALGFAKLLLPETHKSKTSWDTVQNVPLSDQHNAIDALMTGAGNALKICGYLIANLIAFISVLNFLDVSISWLFNLVHHPEVNFQYILGLVFYPFALITGISLRDCLIGSKLIGIKVSLNEFIAYQELGKIRKLRNELIANDTFSLYLNGTLTLPNDIQMLWDESSVIILTYALCGFANFGSMGIALATLGVFAPTRKRALLKIAPRALIGGNMVSLMTASIAGLLYDPRNAQVVTNLTNATMI
ncbi:unnamed protein product [Rotaria sordida]|uniref:Sodium/nucleoside cotransporter n=1 Tax=Rotaria sordida TaxID=392033 RepID=A0A813NKY6_9BILA|nr:unnamed protein product [Rotaria sordida]CAF0730769.1 unnamed protein product [Rotaria sordida]CAF0732210.1 unnamed protein product [Rotaria sordida]CAF0735143.1 unnamed protein product [Rotaria sordida]CAF0755071.1 unnamed protein product [Rotaria sordida]